MLTDIIACIFPGNYYLTQVASCVLQLAANVLLVLLLVKLSG